MIPNMTKIEEKLQKLGYIEVDCAKCVWKKVIFGLHIQFYINDKKITGLHLSTYGIKKNVSNVELAVEYLQNDLYKLEDFIDD